MLIYRTLRYFVLAIRRVQAALSELYIKLGVTASRAGDIAKGAAAFHLARKEDKAHKALSNAKQVTENVIETLLMREDRLEDALTETLANNAELRSRIFTEVL